MAEIFPPAPCCSICGHFHQGKNVRRRAIFPASGQKKPMLRSGPLPSLKSGRRALSARARGIPSPRGLPEFL
ncbi:MAG: hypothetical protein C6W56_15700 [Caldibacillus debilis]|nr:MAG: hypothetical protein C6W56_15700 [Caldibacillus debilis]